MKRIKSIIFASVFCSANAVALDSIETSAEAMALSAYGTMSIAAAGVYSAAAVLSVPIQGVEVLGSISQSADQVEWQDGDRSFPIEEETFSKMVPPNVAIQQNNGAGQ